MGRGWQGPLTSALPPQTVLRIWDCLFNEGSKILFRVALTLIKENQAFLLEASSVPDVCERFRQITKGNFVTECHSFMQVQGPGSLGPGRWSEGPEQAGSAGPTERGFVGTHGPPGLG